MNSLWKANTLSCFPFLNRFAPAELSLFTHRKELDFQVYIKIPSYLRQWFIHRHNGEEPVVLRQGSVESKIVKRAQMKPPIGFFPSPKAEDEVAVCIPYSKAHDPRTYNYISPTGKRALIEQIKNDFAVDCFTFLHDFGHIGHQQKELIYLYMEQRGIKEDGTCWDSIAKVYQRLRKLYQTNECRKRARLQRSGRKEATKVETAENEEDL